MMQRMSERDRLLQAYAEAKGEERARILAKIAILDEEMPKYTSKAQNGIYNVRKTNNI